MMETLKALDEFIGPRLNPVVAMTYRKNEGWIASISWGPASARIAAAGTHDDDLYAAIEAALADAERVEAAGEEEESE
jgi:hypothetical protein